MRLPDISSRVAIGGLVGLMALDVVLVGIALGSANTSGVDTSPLGRPSGRASSPKDLAAGPVVPSATPSGAPSTTPALVAPLRIILVAVDNQRAWRANTGSCSTGGASLDTTADGGKTWVEGKAPPLRTVVRVQPADGRTAFVVGADSRCSARLTETSDAAGTWGAAGNVVGVWFRDPKNPRIVGTPGPATSQPCGTREVLDLAAVSAGSARVLCADGVVRSSRDTGASWTVSGTATGGVAIAVPAASPGQTYVARLHARGCPGIQILQVGERLATSCIRSSLPRTPGQIALSLVAGGGWVAVGDTTMRSTDDLVTWSVS
jgi:hypothetical protein